MAQTKPEIQPTTKVIDNFSGRLTRIINGDLNSGFAKFTTSFGYDPFTKPLNLTWLESVSDITGPIGSQPLDIKTRLLVGSQTNAYVITGSNKLYRVATNSTSSPNVDSVVGISSVAIGTSFLFGSSLSFFGSIVGGVSIDPYLYVSHDNGVNRILTDGSAEQQVTNNNRVFPNQYHPLQNFVGKLFFGNGNTIAGIDSTGTVTSSVINTGNGNYYSAFNPPLQTDARVQDLDNSIDGNYLQVTASKVPTERLDQVANDLQDASAGDGSVNRWNGADFTTTTATTIPSFNATALQTFLGSSLFFANDAFGTALNDGTKKILTLPNNKSPLPNATDVNGNFLVWAAPEVVGNTRYVSLYYWGALDAENPSGLYRVLRLASAQTNGQVFQVPVCRLVNSSYKSFNPSNTLATIGYGKHYLGVTSVNTAGSYQSFLYRFLITPTGTGTPQLGVYETQTQIFSKRISVSQIRVYTEPTAANNSFKLDLIGSDGTIYLNGNFTYTFGDIVDPQTNSSVVERINFNPNFSGSYSLGVRLTNTGTANMTIKKIEIDYLEQGK